MLNTKRAVTCLLAMALASPLYAADTNVGTPGNPNCTASGKPVIPNQFYIDLSKELSWEASLGLNPWDEEVDEVDLEVIRREGANRKFHSIAPKLERRPDFQHRLMQWRINHHQPSIVQHYLWV